jgi:tetratricopeptide (TPR) repeat protein
MRDDERAESQSEHTGERLESWKSIAAYLNRDVRTVQRWERKDGLPIHRFRRAHRSLPYAYASEIDRWWAGRSHSADDRKSAERQPDGNPEILRHFWLAAASLALVIVTAMLWIGMRARSRSALAPVATVTTHSATARKLYAQADALVIKDRPAEAETLLHEAIAEDPSFASAHILLAWSLRNQNRPSVDYLPSAARAEQFAAGASEGERLFIRGSALDMRGRETEACAIYEALVRIQPAHHWAVNNLSGCIQRHRSGDPAAVADLWAELADAAPGDLDKNILAAWANQFLLGDVERARIYRERAERLQRDGARGVLVSDAWMRLLPSYEKWLADDVQATAAGVTEMFAHYDRKPIDRLSRDDLYTETGCLLLVLGRLHDAELVFDKLVQDTLRHGLVSLVDFARDDMDRARKDEAVYLRERAVPTAMMISTRIGLLDSVRARLVETGPDLGPLATAIEGELAFRAGDVDRAIQLLSSAVSHPYGQPPYFLAAETLANALAQRGSQTEAIEVLETAAAQRVRTYDPFYSGGTFAGYTWLRVRLLQSELYARAGRRAESRQVASHLVKLLAIADPDFPILRRATHLSTVGRPERAALSVDNHRQP